MAEHSAQTQELKDWLEENKFGSFFDKMYESGVETLDDLRALKTENEIMELAGPSGVNMGVVFRRKFVRAVLSLSPSKSDSVTEEPIKEKPTVSAKTVKSEPIDTKVEADAILATQDNKVKGLTKPEEKALNELVSTIKEHTQQLRTSRDDLVNVKAQSEEARQRVTELFDKAMAALLTRRKQIENALQLAETETTERLKHRVIDLQASARELLKCKQTIEEQFKTAPSGTERQQFVINSVEVSLKGCPPKEKGRVTIIFDQGDTPLIEFLESYGSVGVGRQKETSQET